MRWAAPGTLFGWSVVACGQATVPMQVGEPIEVTRGVCFVPTSYEQNGQKLNWDDMTIKLQRFPESRPHIRAGNAWAIASIAGFAVGVPTTVIGSWGKQDVIDLDDETANGLLITGIAVLVAGTVMCVVSESEYAAAAEAYNARLNGSGLGDDDDRAYEDAESTK